MSWRVSLFVCALAALVIGWGWATSEQGLCAAPIATRATAGVEATTCFEFWLNRYQALISALLALVAAWLATTPVRAQLKEMTRQSAAAARQSLVETGITLEEEVNAFSRESWIAGRLEFLLDQYDHASYHDIYQDWPDQWSSLIDELIATRNKSSINMLRSVGSEAVVRERIAIVGETDTCVAAFARLSDVFRHETTGPDYEWGERDLTEEEVLRARQLVTTTFMAWHERAQRFRQLASDDAQQHWLRAREMERRALGG